MAGGPQVEWSPRRPVGPTPAGRPAVIDMAGGRHRPPVVGGADVPRAGRVHSLLDPAMRGWLDDRPSYLPPVGIGDVMRANAVGVIVESRHPRFPVGSRVLGLFGVQTHVVSDGRGVTVVDEALGTPAMYLGVLGNTGLTAYFGLFNHGHPAPGTRLSCPPPLVLSDRSSVNSVASLAAAPSASLADPRSARSSLATSAMTMRSTTGLPTCAPPSPIPAREASTSTSTTSGGRSSTRRWRTLRTVVGW